MTKVRSDTAYAWCLLLLLATLASGAASTPPEQIVTLSGSILGLGVMCGAALLTCLIAASTYQPVLSRDEDPSGPYHQPAYYCIVLEYGCCIASIALGPVWKVWIRATYACLVSMIGNGLMMSFFVTHKIARRLP